MKPYFLLIYFSVMAVCAGIDQGIPSVDKILGFLRSSKEVILTESASKDDVDIWRQESLEIDPEVSCPALIKLWIVGGNRDFIELVWWRKQGNDRAGRMLIVALYECGIPEPFTSKPNFGAFSLRFADSEKKERESEISAVISQRSAIARLLTKIIENTDIKFRSEEVSDMLNLYQKVGSK